MLYCGRNWQPKSVKRVIETFETSTRVAKVATDAGNGFLKGMGNPSGPMSIASELVAGELAAWFGLPIPSFAVIPLTEIDIPMAGGGTVVHGPAFISREIDGFGGTGGPNFMDKVSNPADVAKLVAFDTWVRNADRCHPDPANYPPNYDNLFFTPQGQKYELVALDHSQAFVESGLEAALSDPYLIDDDQIYGYFPEFADLIDFNSVTAAVTRLRQIDTALVQEIIGSIPAQWGISSDARATWCDVICKRAARVAEYLPRKMLSDPGLEV